MLGLGLCRSACTSRACVLPHKTSAHRPTASREVSRAHVFWTSAKPPDYSARSKLLNEADAWHMQLGELLRVLRRQRNCAAKGVRSGKWQGRPLGEYLCNLFNTGLERRQLAAVGQLPLLLGTSRHRV